MTNHKNHWMEVMTRLYFTGNHANWNHEEKKKSITQFPGNTIFFSGSIISIGVVKGHAILGAITSHLPKKLGGWFNVWRGKAKDDGSRKRDIVLRSIHYVTNIEDISTTHHISPLSFVLLILYNNNNPFYPLQSTLSSTRRFLLLPLDELLRI